MGANHSPGEKLQTFGLEDAWLRRIDGVRKPLYKTRSSFFRAAAHDLMCRMEAEAEAKLREGAQRGSREPVATGDPSLNETPNLAARAQAAAGNVEQGIRVSYRKSRKR